MKLEECRRLFELEKDYWWFVGTRNVIETMLRQAIEGRGPLSWLDLGAGSGIMLDRLQDLGRLVGLDLSLDAALFCAHKGHREMLVATAESLPLPDASLDLILAADVLEHCAEEEKVLQEVHRILRPGGILLLTVPAFSILWSHHDVAVGHYRRYRRTPLERLLTRQGFRLRKVSYFNFCLFPLFLGARLAQRLFRPDRRPERADYPPVPRWLNRFFIGLLNAEAYLLRRISFPFGTSVLGLAERE